MFEFDEKFIKSQRAEAQRLRKSRWWQNKIAAGASCYYCQEKLNKQATTMDHLVPISRGGRSVPSNIVIACKECNNAKKDLLSIDFVDVVAAQPES